MGSLKCFQYRKVRPTYVYHTDVFATLFDHRRDPHPEIHNFSNPVNLFSRIFKATEVSIILCDAPRHFLGINVFIVPSYQFLSISKVFGDRLLGKDVFASGQSCANVLRLNQDWEAVNHADISKYSTLHGNLSYAMITPWMSGRLKRSA